MSRVCPKPCGHLATAAVFISVGVVQLLVGVILLRSKHADLLSGPDFITAGTNILVGCLYGIDASIKKSSRRRTVKHRARKNVLAALLVSVITVNATAAIVLIMSEGNKLLTLQYFEGNSLQDSAAFAKEVLASAYVTSVCSPIVCLVVAIVALSGNCFKINETENHSKSDKSIKKVENAFEWVFEPKPNPGQTITIDLVENSSSNPDSLSSENSVFSSNADSTSVKRKPFSSLRNIPSPVHTWQQKRSAILKDGGLSLKCPLLDGYLKKSEFLNRSHGGFIPRIKESSIIKKPSMQTVAIYDGMSQSEMNSRWPKENTVLDDGFHQSRLLDKDIKKVRNDSYTNAILEGNKINHEERLGRKCVTMVNRCTNTEEDESMKLKKYLDGKSSENFSSPRSLVDDSVRSGYTSIHKDILERFNSKGYPKESWVVEDPEISRLKAMKLKERVQKCRPGAKDTVSRIPGNKPVDNIVCHEEVGSNVQSSPDRNGREIAEEISHLKENLSPDEVFEPRSNSNQFGAGMASIKQLSSEESPVFLPSTSSSSMVTSNPLNLHTSKMARTDMDTGSRILRPSKIFNISTSEAESEHQTPTFGDKSLSLANDQKKKGKIVETHPKVASLKMQNKKRELVKKIASMASIAEVPTEEGISLNRSLPAAFSKRTMSVDRDLRDLDENYNVKVHSPSRRLLSETTVRTKSGSFSSKSLLKKMWSSVGSETKLDVADLVVDEDSLIGLSEEELVARTLRIRSLRKAVEERLKSGERSSQ